MKRLLCLLVVISQTSLFAMRAPAGARSQVVPVKTTRVCRASGVAKVPRFTLAEAREEIRTHEATLIWFNHIAQSVPGRLMDIERALEKIHNALVDESPTNMRALDVWRFKLDSTKKLLLAVENQRRQEKLSQEMGKMNLQLAELKILLEDALSKKVPQSGPFNYPY